MDFTITTSANRLTDILTNDPNFFKDRDLPLKPNNTSDPNEITLSYDSPEDATYADVLVNY
jgi:hypothetical protein